MESIIQNSVWTKSAAGARLTSSDWSERLCYWNHVQCFFVYFQSIHFSGHGELTQHHHTANVGKILWKKSWSSEYWSATDAAVTQGAGANGGPIKKLRGLSASLPGPVAGNKPERWRLIGFVYFVFNAAHKHRRDTLRIPRERRWLGEETFHRGEQRNVKRTVAF